MSKNDSRLNKVEEILNVNNKDVIVVVITNYGLQEADYFKDKNEVEKYLEWRIANLKDEYKKCGGTSKLIILSFDREEVEQHIEEFRKRKETK